MPTANEIFESVAVEGTHIIVNEDRTITVPKELQDIIVQHDHDVNTFIFDCPRFWDGRDLSKMTIYINYKLPNGLTDSHVVENIIVDDSNDDIIHFDWRIMHQATEAKGVITFIICAKELSEDGSTIHHWNSKLNQIINVNEGLETHDYINVKYSDLIEALLIKLGFEDIDYDSDLITSILIRLGYLESVEKLIDDSGVLSE